MCLIGARIPSLKCRKYSSFETTIDFLNETVFDVDFHVMLVFNPVYDRGGSLRYKSKTTQKSNAMSNITSKINPCRKQRGQRLHVENYIKNAPGVDLHGVFDVGVGFGLYFRHGITFRRCLRHVVHVLPVSRIELIFRHGFRDGVVADVVFDKRLVLNMVFDNTPIC